MFACIRRLSFVCLGVASSSHVRGMLLVRQCGRAALKEKLIMQNSHLTRLEAFASADARFCHMCGLQREQETQAWHGLHVLVCRRSARLKGFEQAGFFFYQALPAFQTIAAASPALTESLKRHSAEALQIRIKKKAKNTGVPWQHQRRSAEHIVQQLCFCERPESQGLRIMPEPDGQQDQGQASGRDGTLVGRAWATPANSTMERLVLQGLPVRLEQEVRHCGRLACKLPPHRSFPSHLVQSPLLNNARPQRDLLAANELQAVGRVQTCKSRAFRLLL